MRYRKGEDEIMSKQKHCPIQLDLETYEIIRFLSKSEGKYSTKFMAEHFKQLMQLCARFDTNPFAFTYEFTLFPEPKLIIKAEGQSSFVIGQTSEAELEADRQRRFQEVALDVGAIRNKDIRMKGEK